MQVDVDRARAHTYYQLRGIRAVFGLCMSSFVLYFREKTRIPTQHPNNIHAHTHEMGFIPGFVMCSVFLCLMSCYNNNAYVLGSSGGGHLLPVTLRVYFLNKESSGTWYGVMLRSRHIRLITSEIHLLHRVTPRALMSGSFYYEYIVWFINWPADDDDDDSGADTRPTNIYIYIFRAGIFVDASFGIFSGNVCTIERLMQWFRESITHKNTHWWFLVCIACLPAWPDYSTRLACVT